jgi:disease resistance protein RPM1
MGKSSVNELTNMSIIQPVDTDPNNEVLSCRVHDMMLDLIVRKCSEENFITVTDDLQAMAGLPNKVRRLSLYHEPKILDLTGMCHLFQLKYLKIVAYGEIALPRKIQ